MINNGNSAHMRIEESGVVPSAPGKSMKKVVAEGLSVTDYIAVEAMKALLIKGETNTSTIVTQSIAVAEAMKVGLANRVVK